MKRVAVIGCSSTKKLGTKEAQFLYNGVTFLKAKRYIQEIGKYNDWVIASAKHGIIEPTQKISNYDSYIKNLSKEELVEYSLKCYNKILDMYKEDIAGEGLEITFFVGLHYYKDYIEDLELLGVVCKTPWKGLRSGKILGWLTRELNKTNKKLF